MEQMTLDKYINTLKNARLQEHVMAIRLTNMTETITAKSEFLQGRGGEQKIRQIELMADEESEPEERCCLSRIHLRKQPGQPCQP